MVLCSVYLANVSVIQGSINLVEHKEGRGVVAKVNKLTSVHIIVKN